MGTSDAAKSVVNPQASSSLCIKSRIVSLSAKLRSTEGREGMVEGEPSFEVCIGKEAWLILGANFLRASKVDLDFTKGTFFDPVRHQAKADVLRAD